ncbi:MAG: sulfate ABC transporter substrate-binding protein [Verrucomicrobia bacterium]|nr:sulfate ABC transporter substrate-binding protein [Verrucomicrobiota bacterium]
MLLFFRPILSFLIAGAAPTLFAAEPIHLLNVSYDPTREFYEQINQVFIKDYQAKTGKQVVIDQSHGGSGKQARSVIDGLEADVVTLGLAADIDALHDNGSLVIADWQKRFPHNSCPYTSTIVLLVRKGNPKGIKDWPDLLKPGIQVITPNPKTSSGGRWNFLAAWGYALKSSQNDESKAKAFVTSLYQNVPVLDSGARGSTTTFVQRELGDVLIAWENEAYLSLKEFGPAKFEIVNPSVSILAEPPVAVVDKVVEKKGTRDVATAYLKFLYTPVGQEIAAKNFYRPIDQQVFEKYSSQFPKIELFTVDGLFGGWKQAQPKFFADGGVFDQIYQPK